MTTTDRPVHAFDSRGHHLSTAYDLLHRPTHQWLTDASNQTSLLSYTLYGESLGANASQDNHRGQILQQYDSAGLQRVLKYDFKGQAMESSRQFAVEYKQLPDWSSLGMITDLTQLAQASTSLLESEVFLHRASFNAQGKPRSEETPDGSVTRYTYNEASLLEAIFVQVRGAVDGNSDPVWTQVVSHIDYDAKGQQQKLVRGNGVVTEHSYDPQSFRLTRLRSLRQNASVLQDLSYTYDTSGNLTEQTNAAQATVFYDNEVVTPTWRYAYDALYRLKEVRGREHAGQQGGTQLDATDLPQLSLASPSDPQAMRLYTRRYAYDGVGNLMEMKHLTQHGGWTRRYEYATNNNQLRSTSKASDDPQLPLPVRYEHDTHGNLTLMPHLPTMNWDVLDRLHATSRQVVTNGTPETTYYVYDGSGQRMRKVTERQAGTGVTPTRKSERLYVGHWEVYRSFQSDGVTVEMERESLSVMEEQQRLALIETKTVDAGNVVTSPSSVWRLQLGDHLGSASLEVTEDVAAGVLTYEEYYPFGTSSYRANNSAIDVSEKRYRYTGKERDEENGFGYHGARYHA